MSAHTVSAEADTPNLFEEFSQSLAQGTFLLRWCKSCDRPHWYPRHICPFCIESETEWRESAGEGTIYSVSVSKKEGGAHVVAYVTLSDQVTILTSVVTDQPETLHIGQKVRVCRDQTLSGLPLFEVCDPR